MGAEPPRDRWLRQDDAALLADCEVDTYRASGPGGQKRNKTSSAVRLRHQPSGVMVIAEESRSQHENKAKALRRLRLAIALEVRSDARDGMAASVIAACVGDDGRITLSERNPAYPPAVAAVLDALAAREGQVRGAAESLGLNTSQLSRFLCRDGKLLDAANRIRRSAGLKPLTAS